MALVKIRMVDKATWEKVADDFLEVGVMRLTMWDLSKLEDLGTPWCHVHAFVNTGYAKTVETFNRSCIIRCSIH